MNKRSIRSFAFGMFLSASILGMGYYSQDPPQETPITTDKATDFLEKSGYMILSEAEYKEIQSKLTVQKTDSTTQNPPTSESKTVDEPPATDPIIQYQLEITSGITPNEIARLLAQHHIIENEKEFTDYLINQNYHTSIQLGSYSLSNEMSYEQIAKIITKR